LEGINTLPSNNDAGKLSIRKGLMDKRSVQTTGGAKAQDCPTASISIESATAAHTIIWASAKHKAQPTIVHTSNFFLEKSFPDNAAISASSKDGHPSSEKNSDGDSDGTDHSSTSVTLH
jgi:hypothetical protein